MKKTLTGYCDPLSVAPGEVVRFMVGCYDPPETRYRADIVRVICGDVSPRGAGFQEEEIETPVSGEYPAREQPIHSGSYGVVPESLALSSVESFTLQAMIYPTTPWQGRQAILGTWCESTRAGFGLQIDAQGCLALLVGDGAGRSESVSSGTRLEARRWCFVTGSYDSATGRVELVQRPLRVGPGSDAVARHASCTARVAPGLLVGGAGAFLFAAWLLGSSAGDPIVGGHFNGKLDSPRLARRALDRAETQALCARELPPESERDIVGFWDFSLNISGDQIADCSKSGLHGVTVNIPTRAVIGHNWTGDEQSWRHAPEQYGAIHFHDDDLYDAGWEPDFELTVPENLRSGIYAARLRLGDSDDYIPFFVRPPRGQTTSDVAFLLPSASYLAYANLRLGLEAGLFGDGTAKRSPNEAMLLEHRDFGLSLYEHHSDGSGVHFSSRLRPVLNLKPKATMWSFNADTNISAWLEQLGQDYDVISDEDLHREGRSLLSPYRVVITGAHPEYHSTAMLDAIEGYLGAGGRLMYMGGNGFYWRVAYHDEKPGVIEVRRAEDGTRAWISEPGEYYHAWGGEYGGLWRRLGRPPNQLVGVGFAAQGFGGGSRYRRKPGSEDPRAAFIFEGTTEGETFGDYGSIGGGAAGQELDRCDPMIGSPPHAIVLASSENHKEGMLRTKEEFHMTTPFQQDANVRSDLVFFECAGGGAVFSTGSIAWSGSLSHRGYENDVCRITSNVLRRFTQSKSFSPPG